MSKAVNAFGLWSGMLGESKMETMIERVAKALCINNHGNPEEKINVERTGFELRWHLYIKDAKAAIQAMHEPTEKMIEAAFGKHEKPNPFRTAWYAMIDAALKE